MDLDTTRYNDIVIGIGIIVHARIILNATLLGQDCAKDRVEDMRKEVWKVSVRRALFPSLEKSVERASGESPAHSIDVALYTQHAVIKLYPRLDASLYQASRACQL